MKNTERPSAAWRVGNRLLIVVTTAVALVAWGLANQNRSLKEELATLRSAATSSTFFEAGDSLPRIPLLNMAGDARQLRDLVDRGGVVAFLTTTCPYCAQTIPAWERIDKALRETDARLAAVSLHPADLTRDYAAGRGIQFAMWSLSSPSDRSGLNVSAVPLTLLIGDDGLVLRTWRGALSEKLAGEIIEAALETRAAFAGSARHYDY